MATPKIVLFYRFTPLADPEAIRLWQQTLAASNNLTGRILISEHGINATVGGDIADVKRYVRGTRSYAPFKDADIKWSDGAGDDFPRLSVKVRPEIVTFGAPDELKVDADGVVGGGVHLSPNELHELVGQRGDDVVFFDGRNKFEAEIGRFRNAVVPDVATTRDFIAELDSGRYDHLKSKPVVTYCTGGVRCEVLSALMKNRGFEEVYQIDGGIVRYGEAFGDAGLWDGSLYVFDKRMNHQFTADAVTLGACTLCQAPTSRYRNYPDAGGRELVLVCESCVPDA
ncbi:rhodanese-related sulfurtransferase [Nocardiaceae bacterium NPDC056970]